MDTVQNGEEGRQECPEGKHAFVPVMLENHGWFRVVRACMRCGYISSRWNPEDVLVPDGHGMGRLLRATDHPGMRVIPVPSFKMRYLPKEHEWR